MSSLVRRYIKNSFVPSNYCPSLLMKIDQNIIFENKYRFFKWWWNIRVDVLQVGWCTDLRECAVARMLHDLTSFMFNWVDIYKYFKGVVLMIKSRVWYQIASYKRSKFAQSRFWRFQMSKKKVEVQVCYWCREEDFYCWNETKTEWIMWISVNMERYVFDTCRRTWTQELVGDAVVGEAVLWIISSYRG